MGWMTFEDGVAYSRNVVAAKVALGLGKTTAESSSILYDMWLKLGYGAPTGIDVAGEVGGLVRDPGLRTWRQIDLANAAFGQGVAVTPIQLATAYSALANGGTLVRPHVVKAIGGHDVPVTPRAQHVVDPAVSKTLIHMMQHVITQVPFYRDRTLVQGYDVGGKTGTAQIWDPKANHGHGAWKNNLFNYSFIGYIGRQTGGPGPRGRDPDRGGDADRRPGRPPRDAGDVLRTLPPHRDRCDLDPRPADRPTEGPGPDQRPVIAGYATLASVTDADPSSPAPGSFPAPAFTADDLARLTGGRLLARSDRPIRNAAVDSRLVTGSEVFVALPGEHTDGHDHLADAVARGAAALIVARPVADPSSLGNVTVIRVADPLAALGAIAAGWRRRFDPLVVGVTGSIAKTSTKEAVAAVLAARLRTLRNEGNQNNEVGLPLTLMRLRPEHEAAVLEMGMYVGGEIADLARMARPRIGVVTAVQPVHLSRIGSLEAIEAAKGELLEALPADGTAILNADDTIVRRMDARSAAPSVTYGFAEACGRRRRGGRIGRGRWDALHPPGRRKAPTGQHPDARPAVGPQRAGGRGRRSRGGSLLRRDRTRPVGRLVRPAPGPARASRGRDPRR